MNNSKTLPPPARRRWPATLLRSAGRIILPLLAALLPLGGQAAGTWVPVTNLAPGTVSLMLTLPDGSIMCQDSGSATWYRLTPDIHGSYLNGTWTTLAPMFNSRRYYSSQVLPSGQVFIAGGEYGAGNTKAEMYLIASNTWTQLATPPDTISDNVSETLPDGNILEGFPGADTRIFYVATNYWSLPIIPTGGQDEASWVKLQDGSILTINPTHTNTERFVPGLGQWVPDSQLPVPAYGWGGELGCGLLLPTGQAIFFGGTGSNVVYTPWTTNYAGTYTPNGATNAGVWTAVASTPNDSAPLDAPGAMMVNGNILCCMDTTNNSYGSQSVFYEYNYVSNVFTQITSPTGGLIFNNFAYGCALLELPDGSVLMSGAGAQLYDYKPAGSPVTNGIPVILGVTTNADGSYHMTGTLFNGISEGAAYGDDMQMSTDFPIARMTNAAGNTLYCRTYNWSTCDLMTGTNVVSTDMALPAGLLAGTYPLAVTANGISSGPFMLTINGTLLPPPAGLAFSSVGSNRMAFNWNAIGLSEAGYLIQRATDGVSFATIASVASTVTNYTDTAVTPLGEYYYRVLGTNVVGVGNPGPYIFAASPSGTALPAPWSSQDIGAVLGSGTADTNAGVFTVIGSGIEIGQDMDQFQFACQPVAGDVTITARLTGSQNTGTNALAGIMLRNSTGNDVADVMMGYNAVTETPVFEHRADAAGVAGYGLKTDGDDDDGDSDTNGLAIEAYGPNDITAPIWLRLVRSGNTITGYTSPDGTNWTAAGTTTFPLSPVVDAGLAVSSATYDLLNLATFDNVTVTGTTAQIAPPLAEWKLDETDGDTAEDYIDSFDGTYANVTLGLSGATPDTGYSAGFNGTSAKISLPPLDLNSNVATITAWMYRTTNENASAGVFFNRANSTAAGIDFYNAANVLGYTWNGNAYTWNSGLTVPSNTWTFVALVISPANAIMYMATNNGPLLAATNNVTNAVQAFDGPSYIGEDPSNSSRFFNGQLDQVQFFNRSLTATQLASLVAAPVINFTAPTNGVGLAAPASFSLIAALSGTNGHTVNSVQFFTNNILLAAYPAPPYTNALAGLPAGDYTLSARLYYDSGLEVDADPDVVHVELPAGVPPNVVATALASNLVNITWSPATNALGYILSRAGTPIATVTETGYADFGLAGGVDYCYTVVATNLISTSAASPSSCVTTPTAGGALEWDASSIFAGPQDGSGKWGGSQTNWWNGGANVAWTGTNVAVFGVNTATNCTVTLTNDIPLAGLVLKAMAGGAYTIAGTNNLDILTNFTIAAYGDVTLACPLLGTNDITLTGTGTVTLDSVNSNMNYTGTIIINGGTLVQAVGLDTNKISYVIGTNGALYFGSYIKAGSYHTMVIDGAGLGSSNGLHFALGNSFTEETIIVSNGPTLITGYGSGANAVLASWDVNNDSLLVTAAASGSVIDTNVSINVPGVYGYRIDTVSGANTATGDLVVNGLLYGFGDPLLKYGTGSLRLTSSNLYSSGTIVYAGSLQTAWNQLPLGTGCITYGGNGVLQAVVSTVLPNVVSIAPGDIMTVDTLTNELTIAGPITNSGALTKISSGTLILSGASTYTGATAVGAGVLQVDGSLGATAITISNTATLAGTGVLTTAPTMRSGSLLAPGDAGIGTLTISNSLALNSGSTAVMNLSKNGGVTANDLVIATGTLTLAGTLVVTNITSDGTQLAAGDSFDLFNAGTFSGSFSSVTLPALAAGLAWNTNNLNVNGTISVYTITYTLTYTAGANGSISGASPQTVAYGGNGTAVTALPNSGYAFTNWSDSSTADPRTDTGVTGNITVTANFVASTNGPLVWNGGGADGNWSTAGNWNWAVPANGQALTFQGAVQPNNTNNFLTALGQVVFNAGGFNLAGNAVTLQGGLLNLANNNTWSLNATLGGAQSFVSSNGTLTVSGAVTNAGYTLTLDGPASNVVSGVISGSGALVKSGAGTAVLGGAETFTGPVTVNAGTLTVGSAGTLDGGTYTGAITNNATLAWAGASAQTLSGPITGTGALEQLGSTSLTLSGVNTYSGGTTLAAGSISIATNNNLGTGTLTASLAASAMLTVANPNAVTLTNNIALGAPGSSATFTIVKNANSAATGTQLGLAGTISGGNTNAILYLNSNTSGDNTTTYLFSGANAFRVNEINLNRGCLVVGNATALGNAANLLFLDGNNNTTLGDLRFTVSMTLPNAVELVPGGSSAISTGTNSVVLAGPVSGANLIKQGGGLLTLAGTNTYTGTTTVSNGILQVNGSIGSGAVTVAGGTLAGSGTLGGAVTVQAGGTLAAGTSSALGTLTLGGALTLNAAGTNFMRLSKTGGVATNDVVAGVTGTLTCTGTLVVTNITSDGTQLAAGDSFDLFNAGAFSGSFGTLTLPTLAAGLAWNTTNLNVNGTLSVYSTSLTLTYTAGANGSLSGTSPQTVSYGGNGTAVTALPNSGFAFTNWSDSSTADPRMDTDVTGNITVTANFVASTNGPLVWNGGGADGNWSTAGNWNWAVPANGQALTFQGTVQPNNTNNFLTSVGQVVFNGGGFNLAGNPVTLQGGLLNLTNNNMWSLNATLGGAQSFVSSNGTLTVSGAVTNAGYTLTLDGPASNVVAGVISGSGALVKNGAGTAVLSGAGAYTGNTVVNNGTLSGAAGVFGTGTIDLSSNGVMLAVTGGTLTNTINTAGGVAATLNLTSGLTYSGLFAGSGTLTIASGSYTQTRTFPETADSGFTGALVMQRGANVFSGANANFSNTDIQAVPSVLTDTATYLEFTGSGTTGIKSVSQASGAQLEIGSGTILNVISGVITRGTTSAQNLIIMPYSGTTATLTSSGGTLTFGGSSGTIAVDAGVTLADYGVGSPLSLVQNGSETLSLLGTNTYTGGTTVAAGTLALATPTLATNSTVTVASGAVLDLNFTGTNVVGSLVLNGVAQGAGVYNSTTASPYLTGAGNLMIPISTYTLTYTAGANGTISGTTPQTVNQGANGTAVSAVANTGYSFSGWSDGSMVNPRTDTDVTNNISVTANFATNYEALVLALGPNSYWRLDETNGSTNFVDASGNGHNAVPQGTGLVTGVAGPQPPPYPLFEATNTCAQFNGASNYLSAGTAASLSGTNDFTVSAWIQTTADTAGVIIQQRDISGSGYLGEYQMAVNASGTVNFLVFGANGSQFNFQTAKTVNDGQWHSVLAERSGGTTGSIYIDGVLAASTTGAVEVLSNSIITYIGRDVRNVNENFNGQIDEVAIFTRALTTNQIAQLSNTNTYPLPPLWSSNTVGTVAAETTATYFSKAFAISGAGAGLAASADSFTFVSLPVTNSLTITAEVGSLATNGTAPLAGVMVRAGTNAGAVFAFLGLTATNSTEWIYRSASNTASSSSTFTNPPLPYWVRLVRSTNTFTGFVSSNGTAWAQLASVTLTNLATNALAGLAVSSGVSNVTVAAAFDGVTVTNNGVLLYQPQLLRKPAAPAYAELESFTVGYGAERFTITGDEGSVWQIEESNDLVNWTPVETVTLIGGSVSQVQSEPAGAARYFRLVQVQ